MSAADAWEVAERLHDELPALEASTRDFHDALFGSTLPAEVVDAVTSTLVVLRSTTCLLLEDGSPGGRFAAWEGSFDHAGSCEGTCTHVWNYAQTAAWLFPALERSARRTEFLDETLPDGRMRFRANSVFGNTPMEFHPAVDGQLGSVVRLYREWRFSGDDDFLREVWPGARRALEFAFTTWDSDGDFVLDSQQHNTYDIEFYGENMLANSIFFAALRAGARLAEHLGETELAGRWLEAAELGVRPGRRRALQRRVLPPAHRRRRCPPLPVRRGLPVRPAARADVRAPERSGPPAAGRSRPQRGRRDLRAQLPAGLQRLPQRAADVRPRTTTRVWCSAPGRAAVGRGSRSSTATRSGAASSTRSPPT